MLETGTEERPARLAAATACGANEGLELREAELDGIEVRAIGWQVPEGGPGGLEGALDAGALVGPEIVGDDDVAGLQGRHQDLFDIGAEALVSVSNSLSGRHWELDQVPAVGDPTDIVQFGTGHRVAAGEGQRRVALQRRMAAHLVVVGLEVGKFPFKITGIPEQHMVEKFGSSSI